MKAVGVFPETREVTLLEHEAPDLKSAYDVKFRVLEVGICGTDKEICSFVYGSPPPGFDYLVLGHEALGEVTAVGEEVSQFKVGDLIVPTVRRPCHDPACQPCRVHLQDFCATGEFTERGIKMTHGYMTEEVVEKEEFLTLVPSELRDVGVLVEPLTVAEKAINQLWQVQGRLPWSCPKIPGQGPGHCRTAVVLGAGPVGILGAMGLMARGFKTFVYSRSKKPNPKADVVESFGVPYISSLTTSPEELAEQVGNIDVIFEAIGNWQVSFDVMRVLGTNGVFIFTGIPAPQKALPFPGDVLMRNLVLKNQLVLGTVNADPHAFDNAISDLRIFRQRWPESLSSVISHRYSLNEYRDPLFGERSGIKNIIAIS